MSRFYNDKITELFLNPQHAGLLTDTDIDIQVGTPGHSDVIRLMLKIENNMITSARFLADGRMTSIATAEYLCQQCEQQPVSTLTNITYRDISQALDLPQIRISSALLAEEAAQSAVKKLYN